MISSLTDFEKRIIEAILQCESNEKLAGLLLNQYRHLYAKKRNYTGVGFYTDFYMSEKGDILNDTLSLKLGNIYADLQGLKYGAGFVMYIKNGTITTLEGYCYGEKWPDKEEIVNIFEVQKIGTLKKL